MFEKTQLGSLKKGDTFRFSSDNSCWRFQSLIGEDLEVKDWFGTVHYLCDCNADQSVILYGSDSSGFWNAYSSGCSFH